MTQRLFQCVLAGLSMGFWLLASPRPASATIIFDDHFTGNSGGIPANWSHLGGTRAIVEEGTTVTLGQDGVGGDVAIGSNATVDPSSGTVTILTDFAGILGQGMSGLFVGSGPPSAVFGCAIRLDDGRLEVNVGDTEGGAAYYDVGELTGYTGGPIRLTVDLGPTWFSVSTDSPPFDSGPIDYTAAFSTFTREDLGSAAHAFLLDYRDPGTTVVDRILVNVESPTPGEQTSFGRIKILFSR